MKLHMKKAGDIVSPPIREWVEEYDYEIRLLAEVTPGTAGRDGLIYWFQEPGPIVFDPSTEQWDQPYVAFSDSDRPGWLDPVPRLVRQASVTATAPDGKIYHVGGLGYPLQRSERNPPGTLSWSLLAAMEVFDPATNTWTELAPMQRARQLFAGTFGRDGRLYVFGGYGHAGSVRAVDYDSQESFLEAAMEMKFLGRNALTSTEIYDPETDTWTEGAPMPYGRNAMGAALGADGRIYVVGGAVSYSSPVPRADVFVYDPATDHWEIGPRLRRRRYHHAVTVDRKGRIYAIGGIAGKRLLSMAPTDSVEVLDTSAVVETEPAPEPRGPERPDPEPHSPASPGPVLEDQE
jgi:N-acetylneuraminic acid mutarotase